MKTKILFFVALFLIVSISCKNKTVANIVTHNSNTVSTPNSEWFKIRYLSPKTYSIEEPKSSQGNVSYLILGDKRAIMFDTGSGENKPKNGYKIKPIIDSLTNLPITLLLSHFHFDHNQNISEFGSIGFPNLPFLRERVTDNDIYNFTKKDLFTGNYPKQVQINQWFSLNTDIDLGNRVIRLVNIPGHTKESIAIIDETNKMAFLGDYLYNGSLFLFNNKDLKPYKESVNYLISVLSKEYQLFGAHGTPEIPFSKLEKLKIFLESIENKNSKSTETSFWGYSVLVYEYKEMRILIFQHPLPDKDTR